MIQIERNDLKSQLLDGHIFSIVHIISNHYHHHRRPPR